MVQCLRFRSFGNLGSGYVVCRVCRQASGFSGLGFKGYGSRFGLGFWRTIRLACFWGDPVSRKM